MKSIGELIQEEYGDIHKFPILAHFEQITALCDADKHCEVESQVERQTAFVYNGYIYQEQDV